MRRDMTLPFFVSSLARVARATVTAGLHQPSAPEGLRGGEVYPRPRYEQAPGLGREGVNPSPTPAAASLRVGLGQVRQVTSEGSPVVRLDDAWGSSLVAEWALPYRYEPVVGDQLLIASCGERGYVIGVASGRGRSRLAFRGDVRVGARGTLRLVAAKAIRLRGAELSLRTRGKLALTVGALQEKLGQAVRVTKGLLEQRARDCARVIEGEDALVAREVQVIAATKVVLDGDRIEIS